LCRLSLIPARLFKRLFLCPDKNFKKGKAMTEILWNISLYVHIVAGVATLVTGPVAIFYNFKDPQKHRIVGKTFFYAMLIVAATAVAGFFKRPDQVFFQFLLGISVLVLAGIFRGVRAIFLMKGGRVLPFDFGYTAVLGLNALAMLAMSAWHFRAGTMLAFPILFGVFGLMSLSDTLQNWKVFTRPQLLHPLDWMRLHTGTMLGAFTASTTAFTVNAAHFLPWWAQWFGPTLLLLPLQIYFGRKIKTMRRKAPAVKVAV
jgi:FtsH-binding integral membrane protein